MKQWIAILGLVTGCSGAPTTAAGVDAGTDGDSAVVSERDAGPEFPAYPLFGACVAADPLSCPAADGAAATLGVFCEQQHTPNTRADAFAHCVFLCGVSFQADACAHLGGECVEPYTTTGQPDGAPAGSAICVPR